MGGGGGAFGLGERGESLSLCRYTCGEEDAGFTEMQLLSVEGFL